MVPPAFDAAALISMFENASGRGSAKLREAVEQATLAGLPYPSILYLVERCIVAL